MTSLRHAALSAVVVVLVLFGIGLAGPRAGPSTADTRLTTDAGSAPAPPTGSAVPTAAPDASPDASLDAPPGATSGATSGAASGATSPPRPTRTAPRTAAPSRSRTTVAAPAPRGDGIARQVLALVNAERADAGCGPVVLDDRLTAAAARHSRDMAAGDFLSHTGSDGDSFADRIRAAGHPSPRSENVAAGQESAESVMEAWMDSAGHRESILDCGVSLAPGAGHLS